MVLGDETPDAVSHPPLRRGNPFVWLMRIVLAACWIVMLDLFLSLGATIRGLF